MFTGIVQGYCEIRGVDKQPGLITITIDFDESLRKGLKQGASVAVDGVCLTVVRLEQELVYFDAIKETLQRSTIGKIKVGQQVNIERSFSVRDEIGGHRVSGHVHGMVEIINIERITNNHVITFKCEQKWMKYIFSKGFIALDGASLTIVDVNRDSATFTVHLIPETLRITTFGFKNKGEWVNVEFEQQTVAIVDTVERVLHERAEQM